MRPNRYPLLCVLICVSLQRNRCKTAQIEVIRIEGLSNLMNAAAQGDSHAFEQIVLHMTPKLIKIARYYTSKNPEDILQEIWLKIWKKISVLADVERPEYWLYTVVRHHCYDTGRKAQSKGRSANVVSYDNESIRDYLEMTRGALADYISPENLLIEKETAEFIRRNLGRLKELYSLPMYLYYFNDMPLAEIGKMLDLPVSTVKWRLHTGRQLLKKEIKNYDY